MKLAISNIGWSIEQDDTVYSLMKAKGFVGLEIAPTRIFPVDPYDKLEEASAWAGKLKSKYGFEIPSMQSIWFGRTEKLFGTEEERKVLMEYTKKAIDFAEGIGCKNLVFGCPRNRAFPVGTNQQSGISFFNVLGDYALERGTVISMEANPTIYNTNYINTTVDALELIEQVNSKGFLLNLDVGTMIQNNENVTELKGHVQSINHVHVSEPGLKPIEQRKLHEQLHEILMEENYEGFVSIEMGKVEDILVIENEMEYVRGIFI